MNLEWKDRVEMYISALEKTLYEPLGDISFGLFETESQLSYSNVIKQGFRKVSEGERWGTQWAYGWFLGKIRLPEKAEGKMIVFDLNTGGEASIYVNGKPFGTRRADWVLRKHHYISDQIISEQGHVGEEYEILAETYAGHDFFSIEHVAAGPLTGTDHFKPVQELRTTVGKSTFGIWNEEAYQLLLDMAMLYEIYQKLEPSSLRRVEIGEGLQKCTCIMDFDPDKDKMLKSFVSARESLKPLMDCKNGSTAPVLYGIGHAHIDACWLWTKEETKRKTMRTFAAQIRLMDKYPEYKFIQSQPALYEYTKELYPEVYADIQRKVKENQWVPEGGMYVEADTNITGGEALIRQFLYGKAFFKDEFGVNSEILWLPDVFGYSGALPQIMKGCGVNYFCTSKLSWDYNYVEKFPYNHFMWKGIDGSQVESAIQLSYTFYTGAGEMISSWASKPQKENLKGMIMPFGYGDGGGGPSRDYIENAIRSEDIEGVPRFKIEEPKKYFEEGTVQPVKDIYTGELYFSCHRGTYTSQAKIKKYNRKCENALRELELWHSFMSIDRIEKVSRQEIDELWKVLLFNQFHDILPGSSIEPVNRQAEKELASVIEIAGEAVKNILKADNTAISAANSLSWDRSAYITLKKEDVLEGVKGQETEQGIIVKTKLPSMSVLPVSSIAEKPNNEENGVKAYLENGHYILENEFVKCSIDEYGAIDSCLDKKTNRNLAVKKINDFKMFKDIPRKFDAWDIDSVYESEPVFLNEKADISIVYEGAYEGRIHIKRQINNSVLEQDIILRSDSPLMLFETSIVWNELQKLLKVSFPSSIHSDHAIDEIQFGHIRRPSKPSSKVDKTYFEVPHHKWAALCEEGYGIGVLNDCKYGVSHLNDCIDLTLLKAAGSPELKADNGENSFTYGFYFWEGSFNDSDIIQKAYELNYPVGLYENAATLESMLQIDKGNIIVEAVKPANDGNGIVMRLYESKRTFTSANIKLNFPCKSVLVTDMLENEQVDKEVVQVKDGVVSMNFEPFQIVTLKLIN